ncbi:MAG: metallophosphoesterase [Hyphomicrobium sp.]
MKVISTAIVGDIHYPISKLDTILDQKLSAPESLKDALGTTRLALVIRDIISEHARAPFDNILFVGDFTNQGDSAGFEDCLRYFSDALKHLSIPLVGVPGNHDQQTPQKFIDNDTKFDTFKTALRTGGNLIDISFDAFSEQSKYYPAGNVGLYALNSCIGCRDLWDSPSKRQLADYLEANAVKVPSDQLYEYFDAPYIAESALAELAECIQRSKIALPIVLCHHGVLSQRVARVAIFPEMLNSGHARDLLSRIDQPVVLIHGHTHDDTLEVLANPKNYSQVGLVAISAPYATTGYCRLRIPLNDSGHPIAVNVVQRALNNTAMTEKQPIIIKLYDKAETKNLLPNNARTALTAIESCATAKYIDLIADHGNQVIDYLDASGFAVIERTILNAESSWIVRPTR